MTTQDGPATYVMEQNDTKVTVEKDLVSQAEEEDMEALLGAYALSFICLRAFNDTFLHSDEILS